MKGRRTLAGPGRTVLRREPQRTPAAGPTAARGLQRMVEDDKYCIDILTQIAAATKALQSVALRLLEEHLSHCVAGAIAEGGETATARVHEASEAIARLVRS
jgi:DNA-binding FrmR family transcriptional regulator